jgi:predicted RNA binding protein YcfA (HicA-like mRNA interferase family)
LDGYPSSHREKIAQLGYRDVTDFLKEKGFSFFREAGGSHQQWIKRGTGKKSDRIVGVNFTHKSYPVKTLMRMIRASGIAEENWLGWAANDSQT